MYSKLGRRKQLSQNTVSDPWARSQLRIGFSSRKLVRTLVISLAFVAILPPIFFHFRLRRLHQMQARKCGWLNDPPLICAHGGDSSKEFPNTMAAYHSALHSQVDCIEIDVSRSSDGVLFALHDRDLQRISGNSTSKVGHYSAKQIKELSALHQSVVKLNDESVTTMQDALMITSNSVRQIILDAKVGPPFYEKGLAKDILSIVYENVLELTDWKVQKKILNNYLIHPVDFYVAINLFSINVERTECSNCLVWAKSDNLVRDVIKLSSDITVGYIVMRDPSTGATTNLLRMKGAEVVGTYHQLIDEKLVRVLHRRNKKVYAWTVDDVDSMQKMLFEHVDAIVTSNPTLLQRVMQNIRTQCLEEGYSLSH